MGSVPRVNTVTNVLRRFFSREDSRSPNTPEGKMENRLKIPKKSKKSDGIRIFTSLQVQHQHWASHRAVLAWLLQSFHKELCVSLIK